MTYDLIASILELMSQVHGLPYCYHHFDDPAEIEGKDAYLAYFETGKERFLADDGVYHYVPTFAVELYTKVKNPDLEGSMITLFDENEVVWSGGESVYIESEKMYQTVFYC